MPWNIPECDQPASVAGDVLFTGRRELGQVGHLVLHRRILERNLGAIGHESQEQGACGNGTRGESEGTACKVRAVFLRLAQAGVLYNVLSGGAMLSGAANTTE